MAMSTIDQIDVHPKIEPANPYRSHISGPNVEEAKEFEFNMRVACYSCSNNKEKGQPQKYHLLDVKKNKKIPNL